MGCTASTQFCEIRSKPVKHTHTHTHTDMTYLSLYFSHLFIFLVSSVINYGTVVYWTQVDFLKIFSDNVLGKK
jgi:hypothetical protein